MGVDLSKLIPDLKDMKTMTPHPLLDKDGTLWNVGMMAGSGGLKVAVFKVPPPETEEEKRNPWLKTQLVAAIPSSRSMSFSYFHSFFMTENYLIYPEMPWIAGDLLKMVWEFVIKGNGFMHSMYWDYDAPLSFKVVKKSTGEVVPINYVADPMAFFHIINAYEVDGHIVLDAPFNQQ